MKVGDAIALACRQEEEKAAVSPYKEGFTT